MDLNVSLESKSLHKELKQRKMQKSTQTTNCHYEHMLKPIQWSFICVIPHRLWLQWILSTRVTEHSEMNLEKEIPLFSQMKVGHICIIGL